MKTRVQKWGNSQGIRLPKPLLNALGLKESAEIELVLDAERGAIVLTAVKRRRPKRGRHRIEDLVAAMPRRWPRGLSRALPRRRSCQRRTACSPHRAGATPWGRPYFRAR